MACLLLISLGRALQLVVVLSNSFGIDIVVLHVGADLIWDFFKHLFCKVSTFHAFIELNELHEVSLTLPSSVVHENATVAIKFLHGGKVCVADSHDDDRAWHV